MHRAWTSDPFFSLALFSVEWRLIPGVPSYSRTESVVVMMKSGTSPSDTDTDSG